LEADVLLPFFGLAIELVRSHLGLNLWIAFGRSRSAARAATTSSRCLCRRRHCALPGKLKLILCGFSEAAMAAHAIYPLINPDTALPFRILYYQRRARLRLNTGFLRQKRGGIAWPAGIVIVGRSAYISFLTGVRSRRG